MGGELNRVTVQEIVVGCIGKIFVGMIVSREP